MVCRKGGRLSRDLKFFYDGKEIEIVNQYTYLGVPFSSSGLYNNAAEYFKKKWISALGAGWNILGDGKMNAWNEKVSLFNTLSSTVCLYSSHIWGLSYLDIIEKVQLQFYRRLLGISRYTANYVIRLEVGLPKIEIKVVKQALQFWKKLVSLDNTRNAKLCFMALCKNADEPNCNTRYNWALSMKKYFVMTGNHYLW